MARATVCQAHVYNQDGTCVCRRLSAMRNVAQPIRCLPQGACTQNGVAHVLHAHTWLTNYYNYYYYYYFCEYYYYYYYYYYY